jgi:hypothetical protein
LAYDRGAKRVVGVDRSVGLAYEISNWFSYWNIDFLELSLPADASQIADLSGIKKLDIVFSMAIHNYMKDNIDWMADLCRETFIFEGHGGDAKEVYEDYLCRNWFTLTIPGSTSERWGFGLIMYQNSR